MLISEPKTFRDTYKPLIYFNWLVGMGVDRKWNESITRRHLMNMHTVYVTIITWISNYITLNSMAEVVFDADNPSTMALTMYKILICANSCITLIAPLLIWFQRKGLRGASQKMPILDETFRAVFGAENEYRKEYLRLMYQGTGIMLVMILIGVSDIRWIISSKRSVITNLAILFTVHHPIIVMLALDWNFCASVRYLGKKFRDMNEYLLGLTEKTSTLYPRRRVFVIPKNFVKTMPRNEVKNTETELGSPNKKFHLLREIREAHLELCKLSREINLAFGLQNLISMGISFAMVTGLLYTIYSVFEWNNINAHQFVEVIPAAIWTMVYASKIFMVNHSCGVVTNEAKKTGQIIYELLNSRVEKELQSEIEVFVLQMIQNPVRFDARGFFTLDHAFVQGVIGSITTYLVILIQMSQVSEDPASGTARP